MQEDRALRRRNSKEQWQMLLGFWRHFLWRKGTAASWKPFCWRSEVNYRGVCASWYWCWSYGLAQVYLSGGAICQADTSSSIKRSKLQGFHFYVANRIDSLDSLTLLLVTGGRIITGKKQTHNNIATTTKNKTNPKWLRWNIVSALLWKQCQAVIQKLPVNF